MIKHSTYILYIVNKETVKHETCTIEAFPITLSPPNAPLGGIILDKIGFADLIKDLHVPYSLTLKHSGNFKPPEVLNIIRTLVQR